jgi:hypothetical protein
VVTVTILFLALGAGVQYNKRMFLLKSLTCPNCGDKWKYVVSEQFIRLGRPIVECRACWSAIGTGQKEWANMSGSSRFAYLLQNAVLVLPLLGLFLIGLAVVYVSPGLLWDDMVDILGTALIVTAGVLLWLLGRSVALILFSLRRTRKLRLTQAAKKAS